MILRRFWVDADGGPHVEEVTVARARHGAGVNIEVAGGPIEVDGPGLYGPARVLAVVDPVCGSAALAGGLDVVYSAGWPDGARVVTRDDWQAVVDSRRAAREAALLELGDG